MTRTATIWNEAFRVRSYETDPGGTASIQTICNYLQEAASNHAAHLGVSIEHLTERNLTWMLARLRVELDVHPAWRDEVVVETWPSGVDRLFAMREFVIRNAGGDAIGRASSAWLLIDRARRRPVRLPVFITSLELPDRASFRTSFPDRLPGEATGATDRSVRVRYSDLDLNGHVNNVRYVEWSVEGVEQEVLDAWIVRGLDFHFMAEGNYGDAVTVRSTRMSERDGMLTYGHVVRTANQELARARTEWVPR
jgi:acyl-ACP thioesterase